MNLDDAQRLTAEVRQALDWLRNHPEALAQAIQQSDPTAIVTALTEMGVSATAIPYVFDQQLRRLFPPQQGEGAGPGSDS